LFRVTLRRRDLAAEVWHLKEPERLPPVLSPEEVKRVLTMATSLKARAMLTLAYGCGLRAGGVFSPNGYGLYDVIGNVWKWTSDWYKSGHSREMATDPRGPELASLRLTPGQTPSRVIKGGSYLCSMNYCSRYRPAARQHQENDLAAAHLGFRTVLNKPNP
jgi:formylglycine-generating enzyme required for sulfatase activity